MDDLQLVAALERNLQGKERKRLLRCDAYYEGNQPLRYMAPQLEAEIGDRITQLVLNYPRMVADAYENRLDVEGFRYPSKDSGDETLWDMWQANDGDEQSQQAHLESLIHGRAYAIVGSSEDDGDPPVLTVEHPLQVTAVHDPKTRRVVAALKRWQDEEGVQRASLYTPDSTATFARATRSRVWVEDGRDNHGLGVVPVVPLINRGRMLRQFGVSEFHDIIGPADAANKMATDMMVSGEFHAMPRRFAIGMSEEDFTDEQNNPLSTWSIVAGRLWATERKKGEVELGQFTESDLAVFHNSIKLLAQLIAQLAFLPADYLSFTSDNPTSADAIRASESRLVKRCERKQSAFGNAWEQVQRLMLRFDGNTEVPAEAKSLETQWRDPATPTRAQVADAVVKLTQGDRPIIPIEQAREDLGYTDGQRRRMRELDREAADRDFLGSLAEGFRQPAPAA